MPKPLRALPWLLLLACAGSFALDAGLSDPTRPSSFSAPRAGGHTASALKLTFIRLGRAPLAVINGNSVSPGQSVAGYRLQSLQANSATLSGNGGKLVLTLNPTLEKSSAMAKP